MSEQIEDTAYRDWMNERYDPNDEKTWFATEQECFAAGAAWNRRAAQPFTGTIIASRAYDEPHTPEQQRKVQAEMTREQPGGDAASDSAFMTWWYGYWPNHPLVLDEPTARMIWNMGRAYLRDSEPAERWTICPTCNGNGKYRVKEDGWRPIKCGPCNGTGRLPDPPEAVEEHPLKHLVSKAPLTQDDIEWAHSCKEAANEAKE